NHILMEQYDEAKQVLDTTKINKIKFDADLQFCSGAIAKWQGKTKKALKHYKKATQMCQYKPVYYQRYAELLLEKGEREEADKMLEWAVLIDIPEDIKKQTRLLLTGIDK
ncbi:MAG: hypothetical protein KAV18_07590, partial [Candidatus Omnitrophica bacterium]|nr:hypothetical protein [Candidatus Omnitrophota bacterium]